MSSPSAASARHFLWALGVILSRGVSEEGAGGTGLVPYLDFTNHGDGTNNGGGGGGGAGEGAASCERVFDGATGCHCLRTLRDVEPGEELLIDYGSAKKGLYRFVRTYGFINHAPVHGTPSSPCSYGSHEDILRVHVKLPEAGDLYNVESEPPAASEASETGHVQGRRMQGATENAGNRSCAAEDPAQCSEGLPSRQEFTLNLPVDVRTIDAMIAGHGSGLATDAPEESVPESGGRELRDGGGDPSLPAADQAVGALPSSSPAKRALHVVLEKRLSAYSTSLPEDVAFAARRRKQSEISGDPHAEWEMLCARIRGAEKAALTSAMRECCTTDPVDGNA